MAWRKIQLLAHANRTATTATPKQTTNNAKALILFIDATAIAATETVTPTIRGYKPDFDGTPETYNILAGAAISAPGNAVLEVAPGMTAVANLVADKNLAPEWDVNLVHSAAGIHNYSVTAWIYEEGM